MPSLWNVGTQLQLWIDRGRLEYQRYQSLGARGERIAARYLRRRGYHILETRARNVYGEVDIIAVDRRSLVFVEVKTRKSLSAGHPAEAVTEGKQRRITRSALAYLKHHNLLHHASRFDVIAVLWPPRRRWPEVIHYQNAFTASDRFQMYA